MADWKERGYVPDSDDEDDFDQQYAKQNVPNGHNSAQLAETLDRDADSQNENFTSARKSHDEVQSMPLVDPDGYNTPVFPDDLNEDSISDELPTTAELLSATINRGLETIRDVLSPRKVPQVGGSISRESSLSPPPSSLEEPDSFLRLSSPEVSVLRDHAIPTSTAVEAYQRTLRERKAIQQHPYSLEDAKFRQLWQERGLKPVHTREQILPAPQQVEEDSQDTDMFQINHFQDSATQQSSHLDPVINVEEESQSPRLGVRNIRRVYNNDPGDELPELSDVMRNRQTVSTKVVHRTRQKNLQSKSSVDGKQHLKSFDFDMPSSDNESQNPSADSLRIPRDSMPSPPLSYRVSSSEPTAFSQGSPQLVTPVLLPTPLMSSEVRRNKRGLVEISDDAAADDSTADDGSQSETSGLDPGEEHAPRTLQTIQRRIKGVLPASWLKLDLAKQGSHLQQRNTKRSPVKKATEKGLARRLTSNQRDKGELFRPNRVLELDLNDSDDEDSAVAGAIDPQAFNTVEILSDGTPSDLAMEDVVEEDFIDTMLSHEKRFRKVSASGRLQRPKTSNHTIPAKSASTTASREPSRGGVARTSKGKKSNSSKRTKRIHTPTTSILDAPGLQVQDRRLQPAYLKIAARRARSYARKPPQRQVSTDWRPLSTSEDTANWNENSGQQYHDNRFHTKDPANNNTLGRPDTSRKPQPHNSPGDVFRATTSNQNKGVNAYSNFSKDLSALKRSTHTLLQKVHQGATDSRSPADFSHLDIDNSKIFTANHLKTLFPHRNRSGAGHFAVRPTAPRPAQLESSLRNTDHSQTLRRIPQRARPKSTTEGDNVLSLDELNVQPPRLGIRKKRKPIVPKKMNARGKQTDLIFGFTDKSRTQIPGYTPHEAEGDTVASLILCLREQRGCFNSPAMLEGGLTSTLADLARFVRGNARICSNLQFEDCDRHSHNVTLPIPHRNDVRLCDIWNHRGEITLREVFQCLTDLIRDLSQSENTNHEAFIHRKDMLDKLIGYVDIYLSFATSRHVAWFVKVFAELVTLFLSAIPVLLVSKPNGGRVHDQALAILNRIVVLGVYVNHLNNAVGDERDPNFKHIVDDSILFAARIALSAPSIERILIRGSPEDPLDLTRYPAAETIHLLLHVSVFWYGLDDYQLIWEVVEKILNLLQAPTVYLRLAQLQAMIYLVTSFVNIDIDGNFINGDLDTRDQNHSAAWKLLFDCLKAFNIEQAEDFGRNQTVTKLRMQSFADIRCMSDQFRCIIPPTFLELWFQQYETAWFQPIPSANTREHLRPILTINQMSFVYFINALEIYFEQVPTQAPQAKREAKALIYKIMPNRGEIGATGEKGNKLEMLLVDDLQYVRNLFDLRTALLIEPPEEFRPRIQPLAAKVNFTTAHNEVCEIALKSWKKVAQSYSHDRANGAIKELSLWMHGMITQCADRFKLAYSDYLSTQRDIRWKYESLPESVVRSEQISYLEGIALEMMQHNQKSACDLLKLVLQRYAGILQEAVHPCAVQILLEDDFIDTLVSLAVNQSQMSDEIACQVAEIIHTLVNQFVIHSKCSKLMEVLGHMRRVLHEYLNERGPCPEQLLSGLVRLWFQTAHKLVQSLYMSWDNFLTPQSNYSLDMIACQENMMAAKTLLYSLIIDKDPDHYFKECRITFITHWLVVLLSPSDDMPFAIELTKSIFNKEKQHLLFGTLIKSLKYADHDQPSRDVLLEYRLDIVRALIQHFHHLSREAEVDDDDIFDEKVDATDGFYILKTMFSTMKQTWSLIEADSEQAKDYGRLVTYALEEIELCPIPYLNIDTSWFIAPDNESCQQALINAFRSTPNNTGPAGRSLACRDKFHRALLEAIENGVLSQFSDDMKRILLPVDAEMIQGTVGNFTYSVDLFEQARFIEEVFPPYFEQALTDDGESDDGEPSDVQTVARAIAEILNHLLDRLHLRIDALATETVRPLLQATFPVLSTLHQAMKDSMGIDDNTVSMHDIFYKLIGFIVYRAFSIPEDIVPDDIFVQLADIIDWMEPEEKLSASGKFLMDTIRRDFWQI